MEIQETAPGRFAVRGALTFETARRAREQGMRAFAAGNASVIDVDCTDVTSADSAGLAVLLDWISSASRSGRKLRFYGIPPEIRAVARLSEVEDFLA